jgi:hypothetical protein
MALLAHKANSELREKFIASNEESLEESSAFIIAERKNIGLVTEALLLEKRPSLDSIDLNEWRKISNNSSIMSLFMSFYTGRY